MLYVGIVSHAYLTQRFRNCSQVGQEQAPVTVTCWENMLCISFYPRYHETPILIHDGNEVYIVPEHAIPGHWIDDSDEEPPELINEAALPRLLESARMAITGPPTAATLAMCKKDPSIEEIGEPGDLRNFLPDSGATQHMTPHLEDLFDVVEGQALGVEMADGHVIKCSKTGNILVKMTDDNGKILRAVLNDVMYVPGLSRRLFSITRFAHHGHYATICNGSTTLYFGKEESAVTLTNDNSRAHDEKPETKLGVGSAETDPRGVMEYYYYYNA
jgi:hypothetical protein